MALYYDDLFRHMEHAAHGPLSADLTPDDIVERCGHYLHSLQEWRWIIPRTEQLALRAKITITGASWTNATLLLSVANSELDNYTFVSGDTIDITSGTNTTTGRYKVTAVSGDDLTLATSIGATASAVAATMENNTISLPSDFLALKHITATNALVQRLRMTTHRDLLRKRTDQIEVTSSWHYYGAITYVGTQPTPVLEVYPTASQNDADAFTMFYYAGWTKNTGDTGQVPIPEWLELFFIDLVRTVALGYEEDVNGNVSERIGNLVGRRDVSGMYENELLASAQRIDGQVMRELGPMKGGAVADMPHGHHSNLLSTEVSEPS